MNVPWEKARHPRSARITRQQDRLNIVDYLHWKTLRNSLDHGVTFDQTVMEVGIRGECVQNVQLEFYLCERQAGKDLRGNLMM